MAMKNNGGSTGRGFRPGQSGNPAGRPKGLGQAVRALVGQDGEQLIRGLHAIAFGTPSEHKAIFGITLKVNVRERRDAITSLLDRGFGKVASAPEAPPSSVGKVIFEYTFSQSDSPPATTKVLPIESR